MLSRTIGTRSPYPRRQVAFAWDDVHMNVAAIAAFAAAGISLLNVFVMSRLTRRGQKEQWRRETERPVVAGLLASSKECLETWADAAAQMKTLNESQEAGEPFSSEIHAATVKMIKTYANGWALVEKLNVIASELDLIASAGVSQAVNKLVDRHAAIRRDVAPGAANPPGTVERYGSEIADLRAGVIAETRADIGVDAGWRPRRVIRSTKRAQPITRYPQK